MLNKTLIRFIFSYGVLIIAFGCYGYLEAGSKMSLWTGCVSGGLLIASAALMFSHRSLGAALSLFTTCLLTGVFSYRYAATGKTMPAILAVLSAGMLFYLLARLSKWKHR